MDDTELSGSRYRSPPPPANVPKMLHVRSGAATHVGHRRPVNEDAVFHSEQLFFVADGMGGQAAGDVASSLVVRALRSLEDEPITAASIRAAVSAANAEVLDYAAEHSVGRGMGTTLAGLAVLAGEGAPHLAVFNVGDSRVYAFHHNTLRQVTVDHSEVAELVAAGTITEGEARRHPARHVITRAIGENPAPEVDLLVVPAQLGERWAMVTDGVCGEIEDEVICRVLAWNDEAQAAADALVEAALEAGGRDNASAIVVDVVDLTLADFEGTTVPRSSQQGAAE